MPKMYLSNILAPSKNSQITQNIDCYLGQWIYKNNQIDLYLQDKKIWAIVKDVFGKTTVLSNKNIKVGISGSIDQNNLLKMIKYDYDKIAAVTLSHNRNNQITLWIIPKLKAAGKIDKVLIKQANGCEKQASEIAKLYKDNPSEVNFGRALKKYQEALGYYKRAYDFQKRNNENTNKVENHINVLRREYCLFSLDKTMISYLPLIEDRRNVKIIFNFFENEQNVLDIVIELASVNTNEQQRSLVDNFICAYAYEFLENYPLAIKSYLLLSRQHFVNQNQTLSTDCLKKAESLAKQVSNSLNIVDLLNELGVDWLIQTIHNIPNNDYFNSLLEENRLHILAYIFKDQAKEKVQEYNSNSGKKNFINICEAYKEAINRLNSLYDKIKDNNRNTNQVETSIYELQKEYFQFKLNQIINLYLPSPNDQDLFQTNVFSLLSKKDFFVNKKDTIDDILKSTEQIPEENQSLVNYFTCAYVCEFLEDPISASQYYFLLCKKYLQNSKPELSVKCLEKADNLIREEAKKQSDNIPIANFLEKIDRDFLNGLYEQTEPFITSASFYPPNAYDLSNSSIINVEIMKDTEQTSNNNSCKNYLAKIILEKQEIRKSFETSLNKMKNYFNNSKPRCFICFNIDEPDVTSWLSNTLVPDLKLTEIKTIFAPEDLKFGDDFNNFQTQVRESEFAIIACTPLLKKKFNEQQNAPTGSTLEIKLAIERLQDSTKHETTCLMYLKGDKKSSCPSVCLELIFGKKLNISGKNTDFNYYSDALNIFANMRKVNKEKLKEIENNFKFEVNKILAPPPLTIPQLPPTPSIAFGKADWEKYFGDIGLEPLLPANIEKILNEPCDFWPSKKVKETHLFVLIPNTVNGKSFTMNYLGELIQKPKSGHFTKYRYYGDHSREAVGDKSYSSHWVLMTRDIIPGSECENYSKCCELISNHSKKTGRPYELPHLLDATTSILMHYVKTGERLYSDDPWTWTCSQDISKDGYLLGVGGFAPNGLSVYDGCSDIGFAGCRKF